MRRSIVKIRRVKRLNQLTVTVQLPRLRGWNQSRQRVGRWLKRRRQSIDQVITLSLLVACLVGLASVATTMSPPVYSEPPLEAPQVLGAQTTIGLDRSQPVRLKVPAIDLDTSLITTGKNSDDTLAVPERYDVAAWYKGGPSPGEIGPAIIVGHVDTYRGAAVFFRLKELKPGQEIQVTRADKQTVKFTVSKVALFDQQKFPTKAVYGNLDYPGLRLITCGGTYNPFTNQYSHNTVVYARFTT